MLSIPATPAPPCSLASIGRRGLGRFPSWSSCTAVPGAAAIVRQPESSGVQHPDAILAELGRGESMIEVRRLGPQIGAEVRGVDVRTLDETTFHTIYRAWLDHNVVPEQDLQIEFASVLSADEAQVIAEVGLQAACPLAFAGPLPLGRFLHLRPREMIERHVRAVAAATEAASA
jgi:hypothetical protein